MTRFLLILFINATMIAMIWCFVRAWLHQPSLVLAKCSLQILCIPTIFDYVVQLFQLIYCSIGVVVLEVSPKVCAATEHGTATKFIAREFTCVRERALEFGHVHASPCHRIDVRITWLAWAANKPRFLIFFRLDCLAYVLVRYLYDNCGIIIMQSRCTWTPFWECR